jgi:hypothetical protein
MPLRESFDLEAGGVTGAFSKKWIFRGIQVLASVLIKIKLCYAGDPLDP